MDVETVATMPRIKLNWKRFEDAGFDPDFCFNFREYSEEQEVVVNTLLLSQLFEMEGFRVRKFAEMVLPYDLQKAFVMMCDESDREFKRLSDEMMGKDHASIPDDIQKVIAEFRYRDTFVIMWREIYHMSKRFPVSALKPA